MRKQLLMPILVLISVQALDVFLHVAAGRAVASGFILLTVLCSWHVARRGFELIIDAAEEEEGT